MPRKTAKLNQCRADAALQALRDTVAGTVADHRRRGLPLAIWRNGKVVLIPASEAGNPRYSDQAEQRRVKPWVLR